MLKRWRSFAFGQEPVVLEGRIDSNEQVKTILLPTASQKELKQKKKWNDFVWLYIFLLQKMKNVGITLVSCIQKMPTRPSSKDPSTCNEHLSQWLYLSGGEFWTFAIFSNRPLIDQSIWAFAVKRWYQLKVFRPMERFEPRLLTQSWKHLPFD